MRKQLTIAVGMALLVFGASATAAADEVTDWNRTFFRAALIAGSSPLATGRLSAILEAAVFDAVNGIERRYAPVHVRRPPPPARRCARRRCRPRMSRCRRFTPPSS